MRRALDLALRGSGKVAPNPMVGCVVVRDGKIIGEGFHAYFGGPHAEVNAINAVHNQELLQGSTLYVTLEPCDHFGKTPPCSNLIIEKGIKRVVVGCRDPFPAVNGRGIERLRNAGVEVVTDLLHPYCIMMNRRFFTFHEQKRPYIVLKWAQSSEGFLDVDRSSGVKGSVMISDPQTQRLVHEWRSQEAAILIGRNTMENDNPELTVRRVEGKNPIRIVLSSEAISLEGFKLQSEEAPTWVLNSSIEKQEGHVRYIAVQHVHDMPGVLRRLHAENVLSILVEGGAHVLRSFIESGLWDEARVIQASTVLHKGLAAPTLNVVHQKEEYMASDTIRYYFNES
jgi:diaminohydroxyphosphoribosylaminopyrimidine deaminase/5-amino-6-(5-phosphoribosylamino)uracil reductase